MHRRLTRVATLVAVIVPSCGRIGFDGVVADGSGGPDTVTVDPTFGSNGLRRFAGNAGLFDTANDLTLDAVGRIVLVGLTQNVGTGRDLAIWRLDDNGDPDTAFQSIGYVTYHASPWDWGARVHIDATGRIVVGGNIETGTDDPVIWGFTATGGLDTSFGTSGVNRYTTATEIHGRGLVALPSGGYVVFGAQDLCALSTLDAYTANGAANQAFGTSGHVGFATSTDCFEDAAVDSSERVVVVGYTGTTTADLIVARVLPTGALDPSFGGTGVVTVDATVGWSSVTTVGSRVIIADRDGVFVTGNTSNGVDTDMTVWKLSSDGSLDTSFGTGGYITYDRGQNERGAALARDGSRLLIAGSVTGPPGQGTNVAVWRLLPDGDLDPTFDDDGVFEADGGDGDDAARAVMIDGAGRILVAGTSSTAGQVDAAIWRLAVSN